VARKTRKTPKAIRVGDRDLLWDYARLARMYGIQLLGVSVALVVVSIILEATSEDGWSWWWLGTLIAMTGITGLVFFPILRVWLRKGGLPSIRLPDAQPAEGRRMLAAAPGDWRSFAAIVAILLFISAGATLLFLVAVLGRGGTAEGVVIGVLLAWGFVTLEDARRIARTQLDEKRMYWAAARRPWGAGNRLVFTISRG
jgi:MFS family permease